MLPEHVMSIPDDSATDGKWVADRFYLEMELGSGGMGTVYRAHDTVLRRKVALKLFHANLIKDAGMMARLVNELRLATRITHPNVIRVFDIHEFQGYPCIIMDYINGATLAATLRETGPLPVEEAVDIAKQLCCGLAATHDAGIIHRDLKPQNILLDRQDRVYLSDFGCAALAAHYSSTTETTRYLPPERAALRPDVRSDIYSFGLILYEMLTGSLPSDQISTACSEQFGRFNTNDPRVTQPSVPADLAQVVVRCLEPKRELRYANTHKLLADLEACRLHRRRPHARFSRAFGATIALLGVLAASLNGSGAIAPLAAGLLVRTLWVRSATECPVAVQVRVRPGAESLQYLAIGIERALAFQLLRHRGMRLSLSDAFQRQRTVGRNKTNYLHVTLRSDGLAVVASIAASHPTKSPARPTEIRAADPLALQTGIWKALVLTHDLHVGRVDAEPGMPNNGEAYDIYLRASILLRHVANSPARQRIITLCRQALSKDPTFALPHILLADAYLAAYEQAKNPVALRNAEIEADEAHDLDENLPESYLILAQLYALAGRSADALDSVKRAVKLAPDSEVALRALARVYSTQGFYEEALEAAKKATALDPTNTQNVLTLGLQYMEAKNYPSATAAFRHLLELEQPSDVSKIDLGTCDLRPAQLREALSILEKSLPTESGAIAFCIK